MNAKDFLSLLRCSRATLFIHHSPSPLPSSELIPCPLSISFEVESPFIRLQLLFRNGIVLSCHVFCPIHWMRVTGLDFDRSFRTFLRWTDYGTGRLFRWTTGLNAKRFCFLTVEIQDTWWIVIISNAFLDLTRRGKTVVCTIHQPSSETFALFDRLVLLAEGRIAYQGPSNGALPFLERY